MNNEPPNWLYDETKHVGVDYANLEQVQRYDSMHQAFRDYEAITEAIVHRLGLGRESTVIDLGAGTGAFTINAAKHCQQVYAVDISRAMIECCRAKAEAAGLQNVACRVGGFLTYEHDSEPVEAVVSIFALHHVPDFWKLEALKRVARMLRDKGRLFLSDIVFPSQNENLESTINDWIKEMAKRAGPELATEVAVHVQEEYSTYDWIMEGLLQRAGFNIDDIERDGLQTTYICTKF